MSNKYTQASFIQYQPFFDTLTLKLKEQGVMEEYAIDSFLKQGSCIASMDNVQTIMISSNEITRQILGSKLEQIQQTIQHLTHSNTTLTIYTPKEYEDYLQSQIQPITQTLTQNVPPSFELGAPLLRDYTFENFVVGDCNKECHAAALACAYNPGKFYNPLFIYGNSGLGKTHLLCAVGNYVINKNPNAKVCYMPTMDFVEAVSASIHNGTIDQFKKQLKTYDVLLMDDIQFLANKEKSHEIFFNCYNELINNNKQIIVVSDRLPNEIKGIEERLISRFKQGLTVGMDSPEFETALAILKKKLSANNNEFRDDIDEESLSFLATNFNSDVRALEGALKRLQFWLIQYTPPTPIDISFTMTCFKNQPVVTDKTGLNPKKIITTVADYYNLTRQQLTSKTRTKQVSNARQISMYLIRKILDLPYLNIGQEFGGRDHSTVMSSCMKVEKLIKSDTNYAFAIREIEKQLGK